MVGITFEKEAMNITSFQAEKLWGCVVLMSIMIKNEINS